MISYAYFSIITHHVCHINFRYNLKISFRILFLSTVSIAYAKGSGIIPVPVPNVILSSSYLLLFINR